MARRRLLAAVLVVGSVLGAVLYRKRAGRHAAHVDLYYEDGSMISFEEGTPEAELLLAHARSLLSAVR